MSADLKVTLLVEGALVLALLAYAAALVGRFA